jgi:hypothetical protein
VSDDIPFSVIPRDNEALIRALARISRSERKQRIKDGLAVIKAALRAGLPLRGATVESVELSLGAPEKQEPPEAGGEINEWDKEYGTAPPEVRQ